MDEKQKLSACVRDIEFLSNVKRESTGKRFGGWGK